MTLKRTLLTVLIACFCLNAQTQINLPKLTSPTPPSPTAASLGKYGEVPVSLSSGVPSISIPIYSIKEGKIDLNISLSYHASGIKVEEMASPVGLGWTLNAGGAITRVVRGIADELPGWGFRDYAYKLAQFNAGALSNFEVGQYFDGIENGTRDSEADIFYYNFGSYSGKFCFANNGQLYTIPQSALKISQYGGGWKIITPDGVTYTFLANETTRTTPYTNSGSGFSDGPVSEIETAWYLTEVKDIYNNTINLIYESCGGLFNSHGGQTISIRSSANLACQEFRESYSYLENNIIGKRIKKIMYSDGEVEFVKASSPREDVDLATDYALSKIIIRNKTEAIKEYKLNFDYFFNEDGTKRLKLESLEEVGLISTQSKTHRFEYNPTQLPNRLSFDQDHWGYYNGAGNSKFVSFVNSAGNAAGANKTPNPVKTKACVLEKIIYPTGGSTVFEYENNSIRKIVPAHYVEGAEIGALYGSNAGASDATLSFQNTFTITPTQLNGASSIPIIVHANFVNTNYPVWCQSSASLIMPNGNSVDLYEGLTLNLTAGTYTLGGIIMSEFPGDPYGYFSVILNGRIFVPTGYQSITQGGLRIKKITHSAELGNPQITYYNYNVFGENYSSGTIGNEPRYHHNSIVTDRIVHPQTVDYFTCLYNSYSSSSKYPLVTTSGSYVTYENVTTELGDNASSGKVETTFTGHNDHPDFTSNNFPFPSNTSFEWKRGLVLSEARYRKVNSAFEKVEETLNEYIFKDAPGDAVYRESVGLKIGRHTSSTFSNAIDRNNYSSTGYQTISGFFGLMKTTAKTFGPQNTVLSVRVEYNYSMDHLQLVKMTTYNSKGQVGESVKKYPKDNISGLSTQALAAKNDLVSKNVLTPVLEETLFKNGLELQKVRTDFHIATHAGGTGTINTPFEVYAKRTPISPFEKEIVFEQYHPNGNIVQQRKVNDHANVFLWSENGTYPIAEVKNATSNDIGYTSFESSPTGWFVGLNGVIVNGGVMGKKCMQVTPGNSMYVGGDMTAQDYLVTYWSNAGSLLINGTTGTLVRSATGWNYYEHVVNLVGFSLSGNATIDELRLYPLKAQMITHHFEQGTGLTSTCDINNNIQRFEYDDFQRLKLVRDINNHVLKKFCYNYFGQLELCTNGCDAPLPANWQNTANPARCRQVNGIYTGEQEREQKDINPCSFSFNQTRWVTIGTNTTLCPLAGVYAKLTQENYYYDYGTVAADIVVRFYSDYNCTIPLNVNNLTLNYAVDQVINGNANGTVNNQKVCNGSVVVLRPSETIYLEYYDYGFQYWESWTFYLTAGNGYQIR